MSDLQVGTAADSGYDGRRRFVPAAIVPPVQYRCHSPWLVLIKSALTVHFRTYWQKRIKNIVRI